MTTLNTIIEEEKKEFDEIALYSDGTIHMGGSRIDKLMTWFTTAMQRAYEAGRVHWLRSEIEKLENEISNVDHTIQCIKGHSENHDNCIRSLVGHKNTYNTALTSIITRYKEELKVLTGE